MQTASRKKREGGFTLYVSEKQNKCKSFSLLVEVLIECNEIKMSLFPCSVGFVFSLPFFSFHKSFNVKVILHTIRKECKSKSFKKERYNRVKTMKFKRVGYFIKIEIKVFLLFVSSWFLFIKALVCHSFDQNHIKFVCFYYYFLILPLLLDAENEMFSWHSLVYCGLSKGSVFVYV